MHDAYAGEAVLPLAEIEKGHHGGFLVLWRVALEDLLDELLVDFVELEGDSRIIVGGVTMLKNWSAYR